jgi:hypothetical protein
MQAFDRAIDIRAQEEAGSDDSSWFSIYSIRCK